MEPHNQHQLEQAIISFIKEHPGCHFVSDVHFGISDYFADHCYKHETARTLWKLNDDGAIKYRGGFFFPLPTNHQTTMTNEDQPMTEQPLIMPSEELIDQWKNTWAIKRGKYIVENGKLCSDMNDYIAIKASQWGADQELEACCKCLAENTWDTMAIEFLRDARRPQPPTQKEQALRLLETYGASAVKLTPDQCDIIRRALGAIPTDAQWQLPFQSGSYL